MHVGLTMFATDYSIPPHELAVAAEARGYESLWLPEHSHIPTSRKHRKPDMHVQCSSVVARLHRTRPHVMVAHIIGANQCPPQPYQRNEWTYCCLSQTLAHRNDACRAR